MNRSGTDSISQSVLYVTAESHGIVRRYSERIHIIYLCGIYLIFWGSEWMNEWMINDTTAQNINWLLGVRQMVS